MKKLNLKLAKEFLSRNEMRSITGGSGSGYGNCFVRCNGGAEHSVSSCSYADLVCSGPSDDGWAICVC